MYYRVPLIMMASSPGQWIAMGVIGLLAILTVNPDFGPALAEALGPAVVCGLGAAVPIFAMIYAAITVLLIALFAFVLWRLCR